MPDVEPAYDDVKRLLALRRLWMRRWWWITLGLWATVGAASLWSLRETWQQLMIYFTWTALRYGLVFNRWAALGLGVCLGLTVALLIKETRFLLFGLTPQERQSLRQALRHRSAARQTEQAH